MAVVGLADFFLEEKMDLNLAFKLSRAWGAVRDGYPLVIGARFKPFVVTRGVVNLRTPGILAVWVGDLGGWVES